MAVGAPAGSRQPPAPGMSLRIRSRRTRRIRWRGPLRSTALRAALSLTSTAPPPWRIEGAVMILIPCPWCGPRDETEFHYGGQAHVVYPDNPAALSDTEWARYLFFRDNPKGPF